MDQVKLDWQSWAELGRQERELASLENESPFPPETIPEEPEYLKDCPFWKE